MEQQEQFKQELLDLLAKYNAVLEIEDSFDWRSIVASFKDGEIDLGYSIGEIK